MTRRDGLAGALALVLIAGCSEPTMPDATQVQVMTLLRQVGMRDTEVADPPAVRVFMATSGKALPGRSVMFTIEAPDGTQTTTSRVTDANGVARLSGWKLGSAIGRYGVIAVTEEWGPIYFTVIVPGDVVAIYDLKSLNETPVPITGWVQERHLVLYESGWLNRFTNTPVDAFSASEHVLGTYNPSGPNTIELQVECWYQYPQCRPRGISATVRGSELIVDDSDFYGPWVELYVRRGL